MVLNVAYLYENSDKIPVKTTKLLHRDTRVRTAVLFWQGSSINSVYLETIVGARGIGSVLKTCLGYRLTLAHLDDTRVQYRFEPQTDHERI